MKPTEIKNEIGRRTYFWRGVDFVFAIEKLKNPPNRKRPWHYCAGKEIKRGKDGINYGVGGIIVSGDADTKDWAYWCVTIVLNRRLPNPPDFFPGKP